MPEKKCKCNNDNIDEGEDDFRKKDTGKYDSDDEFSEEAYCTPGNLEERSVPDGVNNNVEVENDKSGNNDDVHGEDNTDHFNLFGDKWEC